MAFEAARAMDDLPFDMFECVFDHLNAFDAHRFGVTHRRALRVIRSERELARGPGVQSRYDRWFDEADKRMVFLVNKWSKAYAEDPHSEYAPPVQREIQKCDGESWRDELWDLITGTHEDGDGLDLDGFAMELVEAFEALVTASGLHRCTVCGLCNTEQFMTWEGDLHGYPVWEPTCLQCA